MSDALATPHIPQPATTTDEPPTAFVDEPFVELEDTERIAIAMQYPALGMVHAETGCLVRREVAAMLREAASLLPVGMRLCIWDAWRPFALQRELFDTYRLDIIGQFGLEGLPAPEQEAVISQYVAPPVDDRSRPPYHTTGGAVDLTVLDADGRPLSMGTGFDEFTQATETRWFEEGEPGSYAPPASIDPAEVRAHRRLLYHAMVGAGFANLPSEWWHYSFGETNWARTTGQPVRYDGRFARSEMHLS